MSNEKLTTEQIVEKLLTLREFITTNRFSDYSAVKATVTNIDSMIVSLSNVQLELEDYDFIQHFKKKETEQIKKAIKDGNLRDAKAMLKYANFASKDRFRELIDDNQRNKNLLYKKELLEDLEEQKKNPREIEFNKIDYETAEECIRKTMPCLYMYWKKGTTMYNGEKKPHTSK